MTTYEKIQAIRNQNSITAVAADREAMAEVGQKHEILDRKIRTNGSLSTVAAGARAMADAAHSQERIAGDYRDLVRNDSRFLDIDSEASRAWSAAYNKWQALEEIAQHLERLDNA
jgi:hypothetical protein